VIFPEPPQSKRQAVLEQVFAPCELDYPWLRNRTIFLTLHGSHAHGTNREGSDYDVKGICLPPLEHYCGLRRDKHMFQQVDRHNPIDLVIYELQKFLKLAANCNPTIIEILFTDHAHHLHLTSVGDELLRHRDLFISKRAKSSFGAYAKDQFDKIKRHRSWLTSPPKESDSPEWVAYQNHLKTRNQKRLELEKRFGYDTKHAFHLVRLLRMALEITRDGVVLVTRPDAGELLRIKDGAWSFEELTEWVDRQYALIDAAFRTSAVPEVCNIEAIERLCVDITRQTLERDIAG
jgi:predicted nucleotidyltransferase